MKHKLKATELKSVDVTHISLVKRAASRVPLRITKSDLSTQESSMINLGTLGRLVFKGDSKDQQTANAPAAPALVAVVVDQLTADAEKVLVALKAAGVEVTRAIKSDEGVTTFLGDADLGQDVEVVKVSPQVAVVLKGFSTYSDELRAGTFGEMAAARGFWNGMRSATEVLVEKVESELYKAEDKAAAVVKADAHLKEFSAYLSSLINALPDKAFKAETVVNTILAEAAESAKKSEAEAEAAKTAAVKSDPAKELTVAEQVAAALAPLASLSETVTAMTASMGEMTKKLDGYGAALEAVKKSQEEHAKAVDEISRKAETAAQAVKTTTLAAPKAGDTPAAEGTVQKGDTDWRTGCFDSALHRRT